MVVVLLMAAQWAFAQNVTNVDSAREGKTYIAVTYELKEVSDIQLFVSHDKGSTWEEIPTAFLEGDVGKKIQPGRKKILWDVTKQYEGQKIRLDVRFMVRDKRPKLFFATLNPGYSIDAGPIVGVSVGQLGAPLGWYGRLISGMGLPQHAEFECGRDGAVNGIYPAYSQRSSNFKVCGVAGITLRLAKPVYLLAGGGYGARQYFWETTDGKWVRNKDGSYGAIAVDAGIMTLLGSIDLSAGATYFIGRSVDFNIGVGFIF